MARESKYDTSKLVGFIGDSGNGGQKGLVPAPAAGDAAANKFLRANGQWTTVPVDESGDPGETTTPLYVLSPRKIIGTATSPITLRRADGGSVTGAFTANLDTDTAAIITALAGQTAYVSQWTNQVLGGAPFWNPQTPLDTNQPLFLPLGLNGRPALSFTGLRYLSDDEAVATEAGNYTMQFVVKPNADSGLQPIFLARGATASEELYIAWRASDGRLGFLQNGTWQYTAVKPTAATMVLTFIFSAANGATVLINGEVAATGLTYTATPLYAGMRFGVDINGVGSNLLLGEAQIWSGAMSVANAGKEAVAAMQYFGVDVASQYIAKGTFSSSDLLYGRDGTTGKPIEGPISALPGVGGETSRSSIYTALKMFDVRNYGALGDGTTNDAAAIQSALNAAIANGGGVVLFSQDDVAMNNTFLVNTQVSANAVTGVTFLWDTYTRVKKGVSLSTRVFDFGTSSWPASNTVAEVRDVNFVNMVIEGKGYINAEFCGAGGGDLYTCSQSSTGVVTVTGDVTNVFLPSVRVYVTHTTKSISSLTQSAGLATAVYTGNHNYATGTVITISGATPSAYNGSKTATVVNATTITFPIDSGTATPATGTITSIGGNFDQILTGTPTYSSGSNLTTIPTNGTFLSSDQIRLTIDNGDNLIALKKPHNVNFYNCKFLNCGNTAVRPALVGEGILWHDFSDVPTYVSATQFTIPTDVTGDYIVGGLIRLLTGSTQKAEARVSAISYDGGTMLTTVDITVLSGAIDGTINKINRSFLDQGPFQGLVNFYGCFWENVAQGISTNDSGCNNVRVWNGCKFFRCAAGIKATSKSWVSYLVLQGVNFERCGIPLWLQGADEFDIKGCDFLNCAGVSTKESVLIHFNDEKLAARTIYGGKLTDTRFTGSGGIYCIGETGSSLLLINDLDLSRNTFDGVVTTRGNAIINVSQKVRNLIADDCVVRRSTSTLTAIKYAPDCLVGDAFDYTVSICGWDIFDVTGAAPITVTGKVANPIKRSKVSNNRIHDESSVACSITYLQDSVISGNISKTPFSSLILDASRFVENIIKTSSAVPFTLSSGTGNTVARNMLTNTGGGAGNIGTSVNTKLENNTLIGTTSCFNQTAACVSPIITGNSFATTGGSGTALNFSNAGSGAIIDDNTLSSSGGTALTIGASVTGLILGENPILAGSVSINYTGITNSQSFTWNPGTINNGHSATTTVAVTGAALNDFVELYSPTVDLQGCIAYGYVQPAGTVNAVLGNVSAGSKTIASGTWYAKTKKRY